MESHENSVVSPVYLRYKVLTSFRALGISVLYLSACKVAASHKMVHLQGQKGQCGTRSKNLIIFSKKDISLPNMILKYPEG